MRKLAVQEVIERFWKRTDKALNGCWIWAGAVWGNNSYGCVKFNGRTWNAHRLAYSLEKGEIPAGLCVLHACDTPLCVNPDHLFLGTQKDNIADRARKGRTSNGHVGAMHCKRGHEFTSENTRHDGRGRQCIACDGIRKADAKAKDVLERKECAALKSTK